MLCFKRQCTKLDACIKPILEDAWQWFLAHHESAPAVNDGLPTGYICNYCLVTSTTMHFKWFVGREGSTRLNQYEKIWAFGRLPIWPAVTVNYSHKLQSHLFCH